jgi:hypothetical protein
VRFTPSGYSVHSIAVVLAIIAIAVPIVAILPAVIIVPPVILVVPSIPLVNHDLPQPWIAGVVPVEVALLPNVVPNTHLTKAPMLVPALAMMGPVYDDRAVLLPVIVAGLGYHHWARARVISIPDHDASRDGTLPYPDICDYPLSDSSVGNAESCKRGDCQTGDTHWMPLGMSTTPLNASVVPWR